MKKIILLLFALVGLNAQSQTRFHKTVYFNNIDNFSGYITFNMAYSDDDRMHAKNTKLVITGYNAPAADIAVLQKAGLNIYATKGNYIPERFQVAIKGIAQHLSGQSSGPYVFSAKAASTLTLHQGTLGDYTHPDLGPEAKAARRAYSKATNKLLWEETGDFTNIEIVGLTLTDLKNTITRILNENKSLQQAFEVEIKNGTEQANAFNFEQADYYLNSASKKSDGSTSHINKIRELEKLISNKKKENDKQAEQEKKDNATPASSGQATLKEKQEEDNAATEGKQEKRASPKKEVSAYVPKTASQMYDDLKAMTNSNPGMLNDPKVRQQLRHLEVDANREKQTYREYRAGAYSHGNYSATATQVATNRRIDTYTKAVGDLTDAAQGLVSSIIAAGEEKRQREQAERDAEHQRRLQAADDNQRYIDGMKRERNKHISTVEEKLKNIYKGGQRSVNVNNISFRAKEMGFGGKDADYDLAPQRSYIVMDDSGKYGLCDDDGGLIYPPQFDAAFTVRNEYFIGEQKNIIAVKVGNQWGLLYADGSIAVDITYDYIYFLPNYNMIFRKDDIFTFIVNGLLVINTHTIESGTSVGINDIKKYFPEDIIPTSTIIKENLYWEKADPSYLSVYNDYYYSDMSRSLINLQDQILWPVITGAQQKSNAVVYKASKAEQAVSFYRIGNSWYQVLVRKQDKESSGSVYFRSTSQPEFIVINKLGKTEFVDRKGTVTNTLEGKDIEAPFGNDGLAPVSGVGYINKKGETIIAKSKFNNTYSSYPYLGAFEDGYAVVEAGYQKFSIIDTKGEKLPAEFKTKEGACSNLGYYFDEGKLNFPVNKERAFYYYQKAADMGSATAMGNLGAMYMLGEYVEKDVSKALELYEKAALGGNNIAAQNLANHYKKTNVVQAVKWFEQAAKSYQTAQYDLAMLYYQNDEVRNGTKAIYWFSKATKARNGDRNIIAKSNYHLGEIYEFYSDPGERKRAKTYYTVAADMGHKMAKAKLATKVKSNQIAAFLEDKNGKVYLHKIVTYNLKKGVIDGSYTDYYSNGKLHMTGYYKNGVLDREWKKYGENGNVQVVLLYKNDKENGKALYYNENAKLIAEGLYIDGNREGDWKYYDDSGNLKQTQSYAKGLLIE